MYQHRPRTRMLMIAFTAILVMTIFSPLATYASPEGNRNTGYGLGALAAILLSKGNVVPGIAAAAGAGIALNRASQERRYDWYYAPRYGHSYGWDRRYDRDDHRNRNRDDRWGRGRDWH